MLAGRQEVTSGLRQDFFFFFLRIEQVPPYMATVPELPLGQMVFLCLAKAGELVFVLIF